MRKVLLVVVATAFASGCGKADQAALDKEFDTNFRASCVSAAVRGTTEAIATQMYDCTLAGINAKFSTAEKLALTAEQAQPITDECMRKAGL